MPRFTQAEIVMLERLGEEQERQRAKWFWIRVLAHEEIRLIYKLIKAEPWRIQPMQ